MLRQLAGQTAIYGISSIVARLLNYLLVPYLTRVMSTAEYGVVTDMYALIPFALVVLTMGMETGYFRFASKAQTPQEKRNVFSTTWAAVSYMGLAFLALALLFNQPLARAMDYAEHPSYIRIVACIIALDVITAIPFARLREQGQAKRFVLIRVASVLINIALCLFFYSVLPRLASAGESVAPLWNPGFGAGYYLISNLAASFVTLLLLLPSCRGVLPKIDFSLLKTILIYSLPLLASGIAGTANEFIDRQMIKYLMPADEAMGALGIYGAVVKIGVVLVLFTQMYRLAAEPFFLSGFKKEDFVRTNAEALKYFVIVSVMLFLGISCFVDLFALIVGPEFRQGIYILPVVMLGNIFSGILVNLSFWYKQADVTRIALYVTGSGLVLTILLNLLLVPLLGYYGAAISRMACMIGMVVVSYLLNQKYYRTPYDLRRIGSYFLVGAVLYGVSFGTAMLPMVPKYLLNLGLVSLFVLYAVRRERIDVAGLVKSVIHRK